MTTTSEATVNDLKPSYRNIIAVYRSATAEQLAEGLAWYADAHTIALGLAAMRHQSIESAAGVIAALSPQIPWERNIVLATRLYVERDLNGGCLGNSIRSAVRIYNGEHYTEVFSAKALKVRNFAAVIADPTDATAVVVDRHAFDIAVGRVTGDDARNSLKKVGVYEEFAAEYRRAARIVGVSPSQMQAVTWVVWRETAIRTAASVRRKANRAA